MTYYASSVVLPVVPEVLAGFVYGKAYSMTLLEGSVVKLRHDMKQRIEALAADI